MWNTAILIQVHLNFNQISSTLTKMCVLVDDGSSQVRNTGVEDDRI